ncbi:nucleolar protein 16-like [Lineus longissimus]|uniref:nucleolar protein 16-like n=1 Tax=Lineus longissimus TaxID=88925 RepID=UPI002B4E0753
MGKPKKKGNTFNYNKNRRKAWKKSKELPKIKCEQIKNAWDDTKSMQHNLKNMGIATNPNKAIPVPKTKDLIPGFEREDGDKPMEMMMVQPRSKLHVVKELEDIANQPQEKRLKLPEQEVKYCIYMMEKHKDNYKAMARDERNYYQDTPKQIKRKIMTFKGIPSQYQAYLNSKEEGKMDTT